MDNVSLYAALGAFLGALISGGAVFAAQIVAQRNENLRHARKLALELAIAEWQRHFDYLKDRETEGNRVRMRPVDEYFITYLPTLETLLSLKGRNIDPETICCELNKATAWQQRVRSGRNILHHSINGAFPDFFGKPSDFPGAEKAEKEGAEDTHTTHL